MTLGERYAMSIEVTSLGSAEPEYINSEGKIVRCKYCNALIYKGENLTNAPSRWVDVTKVNTYVCSNSPMMTRAHCPQSDIAGQNLEVAHNN